MTDYEEVWVLPYDEPSNTPRARGLALALGSGAGLALSAVMIPVLRALILAGNG